jgi:hypothetical protein
MDGVSSLNTANKPEDAGVRLNMKWWTYKTELSLYKNGNYTVMD